MNEHPIDRISKPLVYVPDGAKINLTNDNLKPPPVTYEKRKVVFNRDEVKDKLTKRETP